MVSIIVDKNILLRSYVTEDAHDLFAAVASSRAHLTAWLDWVSKTTRPDHSLQFIQQSLQQLHNQEALALGVFYNYQVIGGIGMHHWEQHARRAQIGYWICKDYEGSGVMYRSLVKFIDFLFEKIGLNKIEIHFVPVNKRSGRLAERLGFRIEGIIRQSTVRNGLLEDLVITGLLRTEWRAAQRTTPGE